jgi:hypothetical protein
MEWISVKDKLPKEGSQVLVVWTITFLDIVEQFREVAYFYTNRITGKWYFEHSCPDGQIKITNVTHWMPLPPPPAGEEKS